MDAHVLHAQPPPRPTGIASSDPLQVPTLPHTPLPPSVFLDDTARASHPRLLDEDSDPGDDLQRRASDRDPARASTAPSPRFFPPLWLARRTFIFEKLKQLGIKSVADLGCGQGSLLALLSVPAYHVDDFPSLYPPSTPAPVSVPSSYVSTTSFPAASHVRPSSPRSQSKDDKLSILRSVPRPDPSHAELHLRKLVGIDADPNVCQIAKRVVVDSTMAQPENRWLTPEFRFEELTSQIFCGNVEVFNASLEDCESLVLTEIIEHLTEAALSKLPNLLFNVYSPRLVVITTPNHAFNPYFPPPDPSTPSSSASEPSTLFPDPTRRTERVFRDPTHLFEFTPDEFETWCRRALADCGSTDEYTLSFTGVGSLAAYYADSGGVAPSPPPSLAFHPALASAYAAEAVPTRPDTFYATQVAVFEKKFSHEAERSPRSARPVPLPFFSSSTTNPPSSSGSPLPLSPSNSLASAATGPSSERRATSATGSNGGGRSGIPAAHQLVVSKTHTPRRLARDAEGCGGGGSTRRVLDELEALFEAYADRVEARSSDAEDEDKRRDRERDEGRIGWMILSEVWRIGGFPAPGGGGGGSKGDEDEESRRRSDATGGESKGERRPCLRELVEGEIGAIISVLLEEDEWVFELVIDDAGQGETKQGIEALRIGWTGWKGARDGTDFEEEEAAGYGADGGEDGKVSESKGTREVDGLTFDGLNEGRTTGDDGAEWDSWERRNADRARSIAPVGNGHDGLNAQDNGGWDDDW